MQRETPPGNMRGGVHSRVRRPTAMGAVDSGSSNSIRIRLESPHGDGVAAGAADSERAAYCCERPRPSQHANSTITVKITSPVAITVLQCVGQNQPNVRDKTRDDPLRIRGTPDAPLTAA